MQAASLLNSLTDVVIISLLITLNCNNISVSGILTGSLGRWCSGDCKLWSLLSSVSNRPLKRHPSLECCGSLLLTLYQKLGY